MQQLFGRSNITLRSWQISDAEFVCQCRNNPNLQRWFRQDKDLTLDEQINFMEDKAPYLSYYGFIIEAFKNPVGFCALRLDGNGEAEFSIGILPKFQGKGYAKQAMDKLCSLAFNEFRIKRIYSDVFVNNPALPFYLWKCGFKAYEVEEGAYVKKDALVDVVRIEQYSIPNASSSRK